MMGAPAAPAAAWMGKSVRNQSENATLEGAQNREVQTVNWEGGGEGAVERGVKSSLKKSHKPRIRGKKGAQTVN